MKFSSLFKIKLFIILLMVFSFSLDAKEGIDLDFDFDLGGAEGNSTLQDTMNTDLKAKYRMPKLGSSTENFFKGKTEIENPFGLRDPFKPPVLKDEKNELLSEGVVKDGTFTNMPTLENISLQDVKIIGVLLGKERRALATASGVTGTVILKEGDKMGKDNAEIRAILPGGIILVEKITNIYGQIELLETVIPITEEEA